MKHLKISRKIALLLCVLLLVNGAVIGKLVNSMSYINDGASNIAKNLLPSVEAMGNINAEISVFRRYQLRHLLETDLAKMQKTEENQVKSAQKLEEALQAYDPLIRSEQERALVDEFKASWAAFLAQNPKAVELSRAQQKEAATHLVLEEMFRNFDAAKNTIDKIIKLKHEAADAASARGSEIYARERLAALTAFIICILLSFGTIILLTRFVATPIKSLKDYMRVLQAGDYDQEVPMTERKDEVGEMAVSIQSFRESLIANRAMELQQKEETKRKLARQEKVDALVREFDAAASIAVSSVAAAATELSQTASDMAAIATQTSQQAGGVAAASNQTSSTVQGVAAAIEEMSASVKEIAAQVASSSAIVKEASCEAETASSVSAQMLEASRSISSIAAIIDGIASQINLLALNATIESARAGDAGKGFAVVASEVKNLAGQTTKATEDIRKQLEGVQAMAESVSQALVKLGSSVQKVNGVSSGIAAAVEEQTAVTQEISANMNVAASGVQQINTNIAGIQDATGNTSAATQQILSASGSLSEQAEQLSAQVRSFLDAIKAA